MELTSSTSPLMAYGSKPHLIDIKRICDLRGNLAVIESQIGRASCRERV